MTTPLSTLQSKVVPAGRLLGTLWAGTSDGSPIEHPVVMTMTVDPQSVPLRPTNESNLALALHQRGLVVQVEPAQELPVSE